MRRFLAALAVVLVSTAEPFVQTQTPAPAGPAVTYRVTFPAPEHHWMQVEVTFPGLGTTPLRARMSRSSPGRYAIHEFAKNVFSIEAFNGAGRRLTMSRTDADTWTVAGHDGSVRVVYRIFGDYADGTYMGVDTTHAHLNMPAAFLWGDGLDLRPISVTFVPPDGSNWKVGTQLFPGANANTFTAPNLQYFMDSPTELTDFVEAPFQVPDANGTLASFRLVIHGATQADAAELATLVTRVVREHEAVFGEFPMYEPGRYTFLLDLVAWGVGDGMEHRNSTTISVPGLSIATAQGRRQALSPISHEFFHNWNVERIRPVGLEPFDLTRENVTCCLWLAEGFTEYYGPLLLDRAGLAQQSPMSSVPEVMTGPGRLVRSPVQMSEYAPFADAAVANDVTDRERTFISYYSYGAAIALALDLSLRELSGGKTSLDDYMRDLWQTFGRPVDPRPGYVAKPYSLSDLRACLARVSGNQAFADTFFDKYIEGRDAPDFAHLLSLAGFVVRPVFPGRGWIGDVTVADTPGGLLVGGSGDGRTPVPFGTPLYDAGVDEGDVIAAIDGRPASALAWNGIPGKKPGDRVSLTIRRRDGKSVDVSVDVKANPRVQTLSSDGAGTPLTPAQIAFRGAWLGTKVR